MKTIEFEYKEDPFFGAVAWALKDAPDTYNAGSGMLVAHDCLEHCDTEFDKETWEDELIAFGATIYIRGESGYFAARNPNFADAASNMSSELINCFYSLDGLGRSLMPHDRIPPVENEDSDSQIIKAVKTAFNDSKSEDITTNGADIGNMIYYIRDGYNRAVERFDSPYYANDMFEEIEIEADRLAKVAEEGDKLIVEFDNITYITDITLEERNYDDY